MSRIKNSTTELIGGTPLLSLRNYQKKKGVTGAEIVAKLEFLNPAGSAKDRVALGMIEDAEKKGLIGPGATIIEPTSGNTGIALAFAGIKKGYRVVLTMPESMSRERRLLLTALGAQLILTPAGEGMKGAISRAEQLAGEIKGAFIPGQFTNPANPAVHRLTTGPEIWRDSGGEVEIFVAGIGTGGTISGVSQALKERSAGVKIIGVEPASSPAITKGHAAPHAIQGIGAGFVLEVYDPKAVDEVITVWDDESALAARLLAKTEGILAGISSGAALAGAVIAAKRPENREKMTVVLLPDNGHRYLSDGLFEED